MHRLAVRNRNGCYALTVLKQWNASSRYRHSQSRFRYVSTSPTSNANHEATDIAVLGGGITGLASAFYLSRSLPNAKITVVEASSRLGGWLNSQSVDVGDGNVVFEQGPRTLRPTIPNGLVTLDLVCQTPSKNFPCTQIKSVSGA